MTITLNGTTGVTTPDVSTTTETISGGTANGVQYLNGSKAVTTGTALTFDGTNLATTGSVSTPSTFGFKNRIINGGMVINQRATSVTDAAYVTDRWQYANSVASKATVSQDTSVYPTGFNASLKVLSSSAYTVGSGELFVIKQAIEGFNFADMGWGSASAKTITISFWVYSSLTGTFGGSLQNGAQNRSYPFTYTISAANTWEQKTVTIAGDTSGTWVGATNGAGVYVFFGLGCGSTVSGTAGAWAGAVYYSATGAVSVVGTNGATFYITGVQLEKGTVATSFDYRPYGTELALCQRYFEKSYDTATAIGTATTVGLVQARAMGGGQLGSSYLQLPFAIEKRTTPSITRYSPNTGASGNVYLTDPAGDGNYTPIVYISTRNFSYGTTSNILNAGGFIQMQWTASAEL